MEEVQTPTRKKQILIVDILNNRLLFHFLPHFPKQLEVRGRYARSVAAQIDGLVHKVLNAALRRPKKKPCSKA